MPGARSPEDVAPADTSAGQYLILLSWDHLPLPQGVTGKAGHPTMGSSSATTSCATQHARQGPLLKVHPHDTPSFYARRKIITWLSGNTVKRPLEKG